MTMASTQHSISPEELFTTLMARSDYSLAEKVLKENLSNTWKPSRTFGNPLIAAEHQMSCFVEIILEQNRSKKSRSDIVDERWIVEAMKAAIIQKDQVVLRLYTTWLDANKISMGHIDYHRCVKIAIESDHATIVKNVLLIKSAAPTRVQQEEFRLACTRGQIDVVKSLLDAIKSHYDSEISMSWPMIIAVSVNCRLAILRANLKAEFSLMGNIRMKRQGTSPLQIAVRSNNLRVVSFLLKNGADPTEKLDWGDTPKKKDCRPALRQENEADQTEELYELDGRTVHKCFRLALRQKNRRMYDVLRRAQLDISNKHYPDYDAAVQAMANIRRESALEAHRWKGTRIIAERND